jgi:hypothetical protein
MILVFKNTPLDFQSLIQLVNKKMKTWEAGLFEV